MYTLCHSYIFRNCFNFCHSTTLSHRKRVLKHPINMTSNSGFVRPEKFHPYINCMIKIFDNFYELHSTLWFLKNIILCKILFFVFLFQKRPSFINGIEKSMASFLGVLIVRSAIARSAFWNWTTCDKTKNPRISNITYLMNILSSDEIKPFKSIKYPE